MKEKKSLWGINPKRKKKEIGIRELELIYNTLESLIRKNTNTITQTNNENTKSNNTTTTK